MLYAPTALQTVTLSGADNVNYFQLVKKKK